MNRLRSFLCPADALPLNSLALFILLVDKQLLLTTL